MRWRDTRGFARTSALIYGFAGIVVPVVGWLVGAAMVWASPRWTIGQKRASVLVPVALAFIGVLATSIVTALTETNRLQPVVAQVPSGYDAAWSALVLILIVTASIGLWLTHSMRD